MRILFMGTPDLAAESLGALIAAGHEIVGVFTRADKPVGRKQVLTAPPVKQLAVQHGIPVWQPATLRDGEAEKVFRALQPDLVVVVAYGRILPPELLHIAPLGCINLHVSLLPKYRGSAPIQWAVLNGDKETGVTIMQLDEGCDTGDILLVDPVAIGPETTSGRTVRRGQRHRRKDARARGRAARRRAAAPAPAGQRPGHPGPAADQGNGALHVCRTGGPPAQTGCAA